MGYDVGRADGIFGAAHRRARSPSSSARSGSPPDGACGPQTMNALRRLGRKVVGGRPQLLREAERVPRSPGRPWSARRIVIDPGHGGADPACVVPDGPLRWTEADLAYDLAARLEGRLAAAGMRVHLTRGPRPTSRLPDARPGRARQRARRRPAHLAAPRRPRQPGGRRASPPTTTAPATGVTSTVGERLAGLVQREIVVRTGLRDCRTHAKTWELLRLTRMPAVRVEVGYLTSPADRARLVDPLFRDRSSRRSGRGAADVLPDRGGRADRLDRRQRAARACAGRRHACVD